MDHNPSFNDLQKKRKFSNGIWVRAAILMLLVGVAGLSTVAKHGQYCAKTSPARQVSISTKMDVGHAPLAFPAEALKPVVRSVAAPPLVAVSRVCDLPPIMMRQIGITVSMQHRAPPVSLS